MWLQTLSTAALSYCTDAVESSAGSGFGYGAPFGAVEKPPLRLVFCDQRSSVSCAAVTLRGGFTETVSRRPQVRSSLETRTDTAGALRTDGGHVRRRDCRR